jgi:hypothetical protein
MPVLVPDDSTEEIIEANVVLVKQRSDSRSFIWAGTNNLLPTQRGRHLLASFTVVEQNTFTSYVEKEFQSLDPVHGRQPHPASGPFLALVQQGRLDAEVFQEGLVIVLDELDASGQADTQDGSERIG